jgi:hypothetical protein
MAVCMVVAIPICLLFREPKGRKPDDELAHLASEH